MARSRKATEKPAAGKRRIEQYDHKGQRRKNNPPVGLVTEATDRDTGKKQYAYDPHLDPTLTWAGKAEHAHARSKFEPFVKTSWPRIILVALNVPSSSR